MRADHRHVGLHEIAQMFGVTRQAVSKWQGFPLPADRLRGQDVWHLDDVLAWARENGRDVLADRRQP